MDLVEAVSRTPGREPAPLAPQLGIEEEFVLVDPATLMPVPAAREVLERVADGGPAGIVGEFLDCQVEYATPICLDAAAAAPQLRQARRAIARAASELGVGAVSTGTPFLAPASPGLTDQPRYRRIGAGIAAMLDDHQVCGMHVHLGYDDPDVRVEALNRLAEWIPLFTALAANSPYWRGRDTGFASWRTIILRRWLAIGVPGRFAGVDDYWRRRRAVLAAVGSDDAALVTWTLRLSHHLPTIELRFGDAQLTVEDTVAICGLVRLVAARAMRDPEARVPLAPEVVNASTWVAARDGLAASLPSPVGGRGGSLPVPRLLATALEWCDAPDELVKDLDGFLERGNGADRQRRAFADGGVAALAACTRLAETGE